MKQKKMPRLSSNDELIDIVDSKDCVVDSMSRIKAFARDIGYRRAVLAFLKSKDGRLCFLRRANHLDYLPGHYALVGGCVQAGESYEQALRREVAEEVCLDICTFKKLTVVTPEETKTSMFKGIFEVEVDCLEISCCPTAFSSYVWLAPKTFLEHAQASLMCPIMPGLPALVKRFYM